jgi:hypothetical protein
LVSAPKFRGDSCTSFEPWPKQKSARAFQPVAPVSILDFVNFPAVHPPIEKAGDLASPFIRYLQGKSKLEKVQALNLA